MGCQKDLRTGEHVEECRGFCKPTKDRCGHFGAIQVEYRYGGGMIQRTETPMASCDCEFCASKPAVGMGH